MMAVPVASDTSERRAKGAAKLAHAEGYVALFCVVVSFLVPLFPPLPEPLGFAVGILFWACWPCGWLFAISGVRRGQGGARDAAVLSLGLLVFQVAVVLLIAWH